MKASYSEQRQQIGGESVEPPIAQRQRRLRLARRLLLANDISDVVGAEGAPLLQLSQSRQPRLGSILASQFQQFRQLM